MGHKLPRDLRRQGHAGVGRDRPARRARRRGHAALRAGDSVGAATRASSRTRGSPTSLPRDSMLPGAHTTGGRAHLREARSCFRAGVRKARSGSSTSAIRSSAGIVPCPRRPPCSGLPPSSWTSAPWSRPRRPFPARSCSGRLVETLMTVALEHAGAERGLLVLLRGDRLQIEAEARTDRKTVGVSLRQDTVTSAELPESLLQTVIRTKESVILDDASAQTAFSADAYIQRQPSAIRPLPATGQAGRARRRALSREQSGARRHSRPPGSRC